MAAALTAEPASLAKNTAASLVELSLAEPTATQYSPARSAPARFGGSSFAEEMAAPAAGRHDERARSIAASALVPPLPLLASTAAAHQRTAPPPAGPPGGRPPPPSGDDSDEFSVDVQQLQHNTGVPPYSTRHAGSPDGEEDLMAKKERNKMAAERYRRRKRAERDEQDAILRDALVATSMLQRQLEIKEWQLMQCRNLLILQGVPVPPWLTEAGQPPVAMLEPLAPVIPPPVYSAPPQPQTPLDQQIHALQQQLLLQIQQQQQQPPPPQPPRNALAAAFPPSVVSAAHAALARFGVPATGFARGDSGLGVDLA